MSGCLLCSHLSGCPLLVNEKREFDYAKIIKEDDGETCSRWSAVKDNVAFLRMAAYGRYGISTLEAFHMLAQLTEETNVSDIPDFKRMLEKGVTHREREDQLKYETDADGNLVLDPEGSKIPRTTLSLRKYVINATGSVKLSPDVVLTWSPKDLIDHILSHEKEEGMILTPQEKKKLANSQTKEKKDMGTVSLNTAKMSIVRPANRAGVVAKAPVQEEAPAEAPAQEESKVPAKARATRMPKTGPISGGPKRVKEAAPEEPQTDENGEMLQGEENPMASEEVYMHLLSLLLPKIEEIVERVVVEKVNAAAESLSATVSSGLIEQKKEVEINLTILHDLLVPEEQGLLQTGKTIRDMVKAEG